jgi:hypothetical protein
MKENQSIQKQVVQRLVSDSYPEEILNCLCRLEENCKKQVYTKAELLEYIPFLAGTTLKISEIREIRRGIREKIVVTINTFSEYASGSYYEMSILIHALDIISHNSEGLRGINRKNDRIAFCCQYNEMVLGAYHTDKDIKKAFQALKLID